MLSSTTCYDLVLVVRHDGSYQQHQAIEPSYNYLQSRVHTPVVRQAGSEVVRFHVLVTLCLAYATIVLLSYQWHLSYITVLSLHILASRQAGMCMLGTVLLSGLICCELVLSVQHDCSFPYQQHLNLKAVLAHFTLHVSDWCNSVQL